MKILITGSGGQLGRALQASAPAHHRVSAPDEADLDITSATSLDTAMTTLRPDVIINAAAYTAVDKAESEPERAHEINAAAVARLAALPARLVHVSTDFVFDGTAHSPIPPDARPNPQSVYGASKYAGERAAASNPQALIVRTAWVYASRGANFVHTMLRLMRERPEVRVVADQLGTPTHADSLARALWSLIDANARGLHHFTDAGSASWYDFAVAIQQEALALGLLETAVPVVPIGTADYPTPARRPAYGLLDKSATWAVAGIPRHWREELRACLKAMT
ncbi:MAG: dTDP-4-dehydrorhamnose reductase [Polymorphobacter sp.]|uniref:dTDP-4-dehydrorhamnose reductase n=1 Tax=Polymorphobacter sp. TaxID=1909290 RepID=UPI003A8C4BB9